MYLPTKESSETFNLPLHAASGYFEIREETDIKTIKRSMNKSGNVILHFRFSSDFCLEIKYSGKEITKIVNNENTENLKKFNLSTVILK